MSRVPRIRFKGFEEDWEQRKVNEIIEDYIEKTTVQNQYTVLTSSQQKGIVYQEEYFSDRQVTTNANIGYYVLPRGYFTYRSRSDTNVFVFNRNDIIDKGIISYYYPVFLNKNSDSNFLLRRLNNGVERQITMAAEGTGQHVLSHSKFKNIDIFVPYLDEQKCIGKYFESIDKLITLHQRKLEKLKIIKKSMLENLFPQNGEKTPKIRFSGFTKDWEQRKLREVCNIITKQTGFDYSSTIKPALLKEKADNTYPFIQNKDFNGTTINMDTDFFIPISVAEKFPNIVLDRPSILISISGRIGNVGFYSCVHKAFIGGAVGICKLKYNDDGKFIIHELESEYGQKYFYSLIKASSHANITIEDIRNMELIFPEKKEEKICISTFFSSFDHLITLHQSKLVKLQKIKKSMLESMFV